MGRRTAKDTAALIEEVARGERLLEEIRDPELRETVRLALRLHKDPYTGPDAKTRSRIRSRVLKTLRPHRATLADRVSLVFEMLAKPTPYAMRALALGLAIVCVAASTALFSAGAVADDPLYTVKIASEQVRVALATTPEDRAVVELSIAEHRLAEAAALAADGNDDDAIVASSEYGEHMARAAAELAQLETLAPETATMVAQLQQRIEEHRATAAAVVARLADDPERASAAAVIALLATRGAPSTDLSPAAAIAAQAAMAADEVATVAERRIAPPRPTEPAEASEAPRRTDSPATAVAPTSSRETARGQTTRGSGTRASKNERAAESARKAADEAKAAAKKAKESSKRTPRPTPRSDDDND
ncbi:MAG TPA: DUF5667 domain-containing protein [Candidatus Limnocylindria bacterium]|nr:DUF5667 domain-containing protein [Candidatus Limnocylindria bacterium]